MATATPRIRVCIFEEMLEDGSFGATLEGIWVAREEVYPATGEVNDKHFWLVEHDRLVLGSG